MEKLLTVKEAAKELRVNTNFVYALLNQGEIPYLKLGSKKIRQADLDDFIRSMVNKEADIVGSEVVIKEMD